MQGGTRGVIFFRRLSVITLVSFELVYNDHTCQGNACRGGAVSLRDQRRPQLKREGPHAASQKNFGTLHTPISLLGHAAYHQMCMPTTSSSTVSDALPPTGSVHLAGQGRPGYMWKRITGAQSTRCGHRRRIARCGGRYGPRWSGAAVSE